MTIIGTQLSDRRIVLLLALALSTVALLAPWDAIGQTRTSPDACGACHSNYHTYVEITSYSIPLTMSVGGQDVITVDVSVTGSSGSSSYYQVDLTVSCYTTTGYVQISNSPQVENGVMPTYTNTFTFPVSGISQGTAPITITAEIAPHKGATVQDTVSGSTVVEESNSAPELLNGAVSPASGTTDDTYEYTVTYRDSDGDTPAYVRVLIDGTQHSMVPADGMVDTVTTGEVYSFTIMGSDLGTGSHTYQFEASDGKDTATGDTGQKSGPQVGEGNHAPILSSGTVTPDTGVPGDSFTYQVTYTDADGDPPSYIRVIIDSSQTHDLSPADGSADTITTGEVYSVSGIVLDETGAHTYKFEASDGSATAGGDTGIKIGPTISTPDNNIPEISGLSFSPDMGYPGDTFTFTCVYTDADNDPPSPAPKLYVIRDGSTIAVESMSPSGIGALHNGDYTDGEEYSASVVIHSEGDTMFYIYASDGSDSTRTPDVLGPTVMPVPVNNPPELVVISPSHWGDVIIFHSEEVEFSVSATDPEGLDVVYSWKLDGTEIGDSASIVLSGSELQVGHHVLNLTVSDTDADPASSYSEWGIDAYADPVLEDRSAVEDGAEYRNGDTLYFNVNLIDDSGLGGEIRWYRDGVSVLDGSYIYTTTGSEVGPGNHTVKAVFNNSHGITFELQWNFSVVVDDSHGSGGGGNGNSGHHNESNEIDYDSITAGMEDIYIEEEHSDQGAEATIPLYIALILVILSIAYAVRSWFSTALPKQPSEPDTSPPVQESAAPTNQDYRPYSQGGYGYNAGSEPYAVKDGTQYGGYQYGSYERAQYNDTYHGQHPSMAGSSGAVCWNCGLPLPPVSDRCPNCGVEIGRRGY